MAAKNTAFLHASILPWLGVGSGLGGIAPTSLLSGGPQGLALPVLIDCPLLSSTPSREVGAADGEGEARITSCGIVARCKESQGLQGAPSPHSVVGLGWGPACGWSLWGGRAGGARHWYLPTPGTAWAVFPHGSAGAG